VQAHAAEKRRKNRSAAQRKAQSARIKAYWAERRRKIPEEAKGNAKRSRKTSKKSADLTAPAVAPGKKQTVPREIPKLSMCLLASIFTSTAGRGRWKIENETFNTLKNQGYHFEHNYGHGEQHLATALAMLLMLAFLMDQIQQLCCRSFVGYGGSWGRK
jgi:hypothetical protein